MWLGGSSSSCRMYSPRSVSRTSIPAPSSAGFRSISSVSMLLPLTTVATEWSAAMAVTMRHASSASAAQWTWAPLASRPLLGLGEMVVQVREGVVLHRLRPAAPRFRVNVGVGLGGASGRTRGWRR